MSSARPGSLFEFAWCWLWGMKERENPQDVVGQGLLLNACAGLLRVCDLESRHRFSRPNLPQDFFFNQLNASADQILNWQKMTQFKKRESGREGFNLASSMTRVPKLYLQVLWGFLLFFSLLLFLHKTPCRKQGKMTNALILQTLTHVVSFKCVSYPAEVS